MDHGRTLAILCCPDGKPSGRVFDWLFGLSTERDIEIERVDFCRPIEKAANAACRKFLKSDCDRLWFVANDMIPYPATDAVLDVDADIVLGWTFIVDDEAHGGVHSNIYRTRNYGRTFDTIPFDPRATEPMDCDAGGMHSAVIKRRVLEDPRMKCGVGAFYRTHYSDDGTVTRTDDVDFCWRARELGYSIKFHPAALSGHVQTVDIVDFYLRAARSRAGE